MLLRAKQMILMVVCCSGVQLTKAMEQEEYSSKKQTIEAQETSLTYLDSLSANIINGHIINSLFHNATASAYNIHYAIDNIRSLSQACSLISNPRIIEELIKLLYNQYGYYTYAEIAIELNTPGATEWFKRYMREDPQGEKTLDQLLMEAARVGNSEAIQFLLENKADINVQDKGGYTSLYYAAGWGRKEAVKALLEAGAEVNKANDAAATPLLAASCASSYREGYKDIVQLLLHYEADVNLQNTGGNTPLHYAVISWSDLENKDIVKLLLDAKADANAVNKDGDTPLHYVAALGKYHTRKNIKDIIRLLHEYGADINKVNNSGETPLCKATHCDNKDIVEIFTSFWG